MLIEVEVGMGRCGSEPGMPTLTLAREVLKLPNLRFEGIMGYEGHAVMIPDPNNESGHCQSGDGVAGGNS